MRTNFFPFIFYDLLQDLSKRMIFLQFDIHELLIIQLDPLLSFI